MFQRSCADAPRGLRIITAGAPPAAATIERVEGELGWEITQAYGLTETSPFITICESRPEHAKLRPYERCVLKACQGVELLTSGELQVVDDDGAEVPHDGQTLGEIVVRGNAVMKGYYRDDEATAHVMRGGWFHTGDAAVVHPNGYAEIRDRLKDVIISGGENISSVEVEGLLLRHPAVQEVAIVGLPHERWGEAPHAFVVLRPAAQTTEGELMQFARDNLAHFKAPHGVTFVTELPKTATGKIQNMFSVVKRGSSSSKASFAIARAQNTMKLESPSVQVAGFISKFDPSIARIVRETRSALRKQFPSANELVYDNYNALAIGYSPSERTSDVIFSLAVYPRWVDLYFMYGRSLPDPSGVLQGNGVQGAFVRLQGVKTLDQPPVKTMIGEAIKFSRLKFATTEKGKTIVKSISAKQRPRRPVKR